MAGKTSEYLALVKSKGRKAKFALTCVEREEGEVHGAHEVDVQLEDVDDRDILAPTLPGQRDAAHGDHVTVRLLSVEVPDEQVWLPYRAQEALIYTEGSIFGQVDPVVHPFQPDVETEVQGECFWMDLKDVLQKDGCLYHKGSSGVW